MTWGCLSRCRLYCIAKAVTFVAAFLILLRLIIMTTREKVRWNFSELEPECCRVTFKRAWQSNFRTFIKIKGYESNRNQKQNVRTRRVPTKH